MKLSYCQIPPNQVEKVWEKCVPHLQAAISYSVGESSIEHFRRGIMAGRMDLFVGYDAGGDVHVAMVTQFVEYPLMTVLRVILIGGDEPMILEQCVNEYWPTLKAWSRSKGASKWEATCHPAMARLLHQSGFKSKYTVVFLDLE